MHSSVINLQDIQKEIHLKNKKKTFKTEIIAVSKTFSLEQIKPLIDYGHNHFGENKVQEAVDKWKLIKKTNSNINLHLIGKLQTNKVKYAVPLFDYIHSVDNEKLAEKISIEEKKHRRKIKIFIQVNIGDESQKNGIDPKLLRNFYKKCVDDMNLNVVGLMCIPPLNTDSKTYFNHMTVLAKDIGLTELSMGMSSDYLDAIEYGASFVRIGTKIFGNRS
ncbi:YggS family pyridoxal phosphate-dependent enzyme [Candidatus Pelagibacter communis]|uniref:YggS family pyridoxal phosphate-dependent enzyme n=1 Tax=Pelagibacter ubique TaxID=198252 RepID=UPI00094CB379|nr:YggS family pyridoxal phosphate-dependent enzyme [Candidatus Pelagibacter ubique]|tara:strand:- start:1815 stop:2471 length:657 start_codon:yes stop_codon:yes gene_type:complete